MKRNNGIRGTSSKRARKREQIATLSVLRIGPTDPVTQLKLPRAVDEARIDEGEEAMKQKWKSL